MIKYFIVGAAGVVTGGVVVGAFILGQLADGFGKAFGYK